MPSVLHPARRRFVLGLWGSLIIAAVGTVSYLVGAPGYQITFCIFIVYVIWLYTRYQRERKLPIDFAPWYTSRAKAGLFGALLNVIVGIFAFVKHSDDYEVFFCLAAVLLVGAALFHFKETRGNQSSTDQE